jgi:hypothetical protein
MASRATRTTRPGKALRSLEPQAAAMVTGDDSMTSTIRTTPRSKPKEIVVVGTPKPTPR